MGKGGGVCRVDRVLVVMRLVGREEDGMVSGARSGSEGINPLECGVVLCCWWCNGECLWCGGLP